MRILADMGVSGSTVEALRNGDHDAVHLRDLGLQRLPDEQILQLAAEQGRLIVTFDLDFAELVAVGGTIFPSVVLFRLRNHVPDRVSAILLAILADCEDVLNAGAFISVAEGGYRVRRLPIGK
jgi:predicted nuclease of predicted toxin-antitoxin system